MSDTGSDMEWVGTTEEVVEVQECLSINVPPAVVPTVEPSQSSIQQLLNTVVQEETPEAQDGFSCEECLALFQDQSDPDYINGPSFILDYPTSMGVPQRALLTLPYGLMIGRSSIPVAGVGVINHGPVVSPGMHFGPYEGVLTTNEDAMASDFSWEICKGKDQYEYIDGAKDSYSNWMRYVNFARNKEETNLLAVQYKGSILFHCCRTIHTGDELMVWPSRKLLTQSSEPWNQKWFLQLNTAAESSVSAASPLFVCSQCQLSFTTEAFLQRHTEYFHTQPKATEDVDNGDQASDLDSGPSAASVAVVVVDSTKSKTCDDCGKVFKQIPHLRRHKLSVHSNKRPYCCPHCRRSFTQASGLIRHQYVHRKQAVMKAPNQNEVPGETENSAPREEILTTEEPAESERTEVINVTDDLKEGTDATDTVTTSAGEAETHALNCSDCSKSFENEPAFKKHKASVHEKLRPYVCAVCQKCFGQYHDLNRHLKNHKRQNERGERRSKDPEDPSVMPFSCAHCSVTFSTVDDLQQHINELHSDDTPEENQVVSVASTESVQHPSRRPQRLRARSKISAITKLIAPKRKQACPAQTEMSSTEPEASTVRNTKLMKYKWFSCNCCKQTYGNPEDLKAHKCTVQQHKCEQCGKAFSKQTSLKRHEQMEHAKAKSYTCDLCGKDFSSSSKLKQHQKSNSCMKYHCTSELFPCPFCQFSFTMKSYLIKHIKRHHPVEFLSYSDQDGLTDQPDGKEGEYICPHCGINCANAKAFKSHTCFRQLKVLYLCTDCGKGFTNHYGLKQHQRIHTGEKPYSCPHCSKSFSYCGQLNVHLRTHTGEKPYLCTHCGESFRQSGDLKRHERKHTGVRPHNCSECNKSFSRPQSLKAHQMLHLGQRMFKCTQCGKSFSRNYHLRRHHQKMHT
ncbi:histone-lysine N-methyltransferase PRDM9-like isoform X2 [Melanotaenia boesemani]|uniref:histone-lysine N-methyltransferase PRDM9-like isoform X2 n=1 Tax=Melanotaenia boesemani TaxID=1250792 RepID=UPI001C0576B2|nr:histone-lysine N-methyltransferase PRDM9-like isoform X2 [Melanotaenia boesemani]